MGNTRDVQYLVEQPEYVAYPIQCAVCDTDVPFQSDMLLARDKNQQPLCENHEDAAEELVTIERHIGYPNNNLHPETGEPGWLDNEGTGYTWFKVVDSRSI